MKLHIHVHKRVRRLGLNDYYQCRCGDRKYMRRGRRGFSPVDRQWLDGGDWTREPTVGPVGGSGQAKASLPPLEVNIEELLKEDPTPALAPESEYSLPENIREIKFENGSIRYQDARTGKFIPKSQVQLRVQ